MAAILSRPQGVNSCGAETVIFLENMVNTMATDALAPCVTRSSMSSYGIRYAGKTRPCLPWGRISMTCVVLNFVS